MKSWVLSQFNVIDHYHFYHAAVIPSNVPEKRDDDNKPLVWWIVFFVLIFQTLHCISDHIDWLLKFVHILLQFVARYSPKLQGAAAAFPISLHLQDKFVKGCIYITSVERYASCATCHSVYKFNDCFVKRGTWLVTKWCSSVSHSKNALQL